MRKPPHQFVECRPPAATGDEGACHHRGFTMFEILIVLGMLVVITGMVLPAMFDRIEHARLPASARQLRALLQFTRNTAMLEGFRYRIRFPSVEDEEGELDATGDVRQPIIEVEDRPLEKPGEFRPVLACWAQDEVFATGIRCARVRLGKPTVEVLLGDSELDVEMEEDVEESLEGTDTEFDEGFPPLVIEPDGTSEWATFLLTDAPIEVEYEDLVESEQGEYGQIEIILDGVIGLAWLQRPLMEEELEMMAENGWPPVMRKDFLRPELLTEDDVLEIRDMAIGR